MENFLPALQIMLGTNLFHTLFDGVEAETALFTISFMSYSVLILALGTAFGISWYRNRRPQFLAPPPYVAIIIIFVFFASANAESAQFNQTQIRSSRSIIPFGIPAGIPLSIIGKLFKGGSTLMATVAGYLGLSWLADIIIDDRDREDFPTHWVVVICSIPAIAFLGILYTIYHWRVCFEHHRRRQRETQERAEHFRRYFHTENPSGYNFPLQNFHRERPSSYLMHESEYNSGIHPTPQRENRELAKTLAYEAQRTRDLTQKTKRESKQKVENTDSDIEAPRHVVFRH